MMTASISTTPADVGTSRETESFLRPFVANVFACTCCVPGFMDRRDWSGAGDGTFSREVS